MINVDDIVTTSGLAAELGMSVQTANAILADVPSVKVGRTHLYERSAVRQVIAEKNSKVLQFLGFPVDLSLSYDANNVQA